MARERRTPLIIPPATEHRDGIEGATVVCLAPAMLVEQRAYRIRIQKAGIGCARRRPGFVSEIAEAPDEPVRQRHLEAELAALRNRWREPCRNI